MNELKPEDVMNALECCIKTQCKNCCNLGSWHEQWNCMTDLMKKALALLREKDAEIERLTAYNANLLCANTYITNCHKEYVEEAERIARRDAITEFAERLKERMREVYPADIYDSDIDEIAKELS